jgi:hypothetical protein
MQFMLLHISYANNAVFACLAAITAGSMFAFCEIEAQFGQQTSRRCIVASEDSPYSQLLLRQCSNGKWRLPNIYKCINSHINYRKLSRYGLLTPITAEASGCWGCTGCTRGCCRRRWSRAYSSGPTSRYWSPLRTYPTTTRRWSSQGASRRRRPCTTSRHTCHRRSPTGCTRAHPARRHRSYASCSTHWTVE